jgi:hypothetical protein
VPSGGTTQYGGTVLSGGTVPVDRGFYLVVRVSSIQNVVFLAAVRDNDIFHWFSLFPLN